MLKYRCLNEDCFEDGGMFEWYAEPVIPSQPDRGRKCPNCPKCGLGEEDEMVIELAVIHFDPPSRKRGRGLGIMACTGKPWGNRMVSCHPLPVTCLECRKTEYWLKAMSKHHGLEVKT